MKTERQRNGASAEAEAVAYVAELGWRVVVRNLKVGRDELDILAVDPGPPVTLVVVEVRSLRTAAFGEPEERVDRAKVGRLYRALAGLGTSLETGEGLGRLPRRVDLVIVDRRSGKPEIRHLRALEPP
ncbi:MAG: YraN family protein [Chloroflexota bacterium]